MRVQGTFTFIISKNYGHPLSWSLPAWRVYLASGLAALMLTGMVVSAVLFLATYPRLLRIEKERDQLRRQRDALQEQILSANQEAFDRKEAVLVRVALPGRPSAPDAREGPAADGEAYLPPLQITMVTSKVNRQAVEVVFRIAQLGEDGTNRGGFLFAIFENRDQDPPQFLPSPAVALNQEGFPQSYKSGIRFSRVSKGITYRRSIKRRGSEDYFTHVTLYLFSLRGGLLVKDRFAMEREMFRNDAPAVKPLELAQN